MLPLQFGVPGGPEILILLLILVMMGLPVALIVLVVLGVLRLTGTGSEDDHVRELERRVDRLETELEAERSSEDEASLSSDRDE